MSQILSKFSSIFNPSLYFYKVNFYKAIIRPFLFCFNPENAHNLAFSFLKLIFKIPGASFLSSKIFSVSDNRLHKNVFGIDFPNPVGLAAGLDKNADFVQELACFGFAFIEVGTVTPLPQPGNEKPRMFRLPADEALINRMGFNNSGVKEMALRLKGRKSRIIIGGNIGKNKSTPNELALNDYEICFRELFSLVDYFAVNVSSPNTPGLRSLQDKGPLLEILLRLQVVNYELSVKNNTSRRPILLKIAPDLSDDQLDEIIEVVLKSKLDGVIATNTTISRDGLKTSSDIVHHSGAGGLSGKPLGKRSTEIIGYLSTHSKNQFSIIGVGGIHSPEDALEKINAGADLIQIYTGFVYEGPALVKKINQALLRRFQ